MTSSKPFVTACIPAFNGEEFVAQTIACVCSQTYKNLHILISVDQSDDKTLNVCRHQSINQNIEIVEQKQRLGFIGNIEYLLNRVKTPFSFIMPHDDLIDPNYVEVLVNLLQNNPVATVAYCDIQRFGLYDTKFQQSPAGGNRLVRSLEYLRLHGAAVPFRGLIRMKALTQPIRMPRNGFDDFATDTAFLLGLLLKGPFVHHEVCLYQKRVHSKSKYREWVAHCSEWRLKAWLAHCIDCAEVALPNFRTDTERALVLDALCDRLLMTKKNLWMPSSIGGLTPLEQHSLLKEFVLKLGKVSSGRYFIRAAKMRLAALGHDCLNV